MSPQDNQNRSQSDRSDAGQRATNRPVERPIDSTREQRKDMPADRERQQNAERSVPKKNGQQSSNQ